MGIPQTFRHAQLARRLLSLREAYTPSIAEEFLPTLELQYPGAPESFSLRDEHLVLGGNSQFASVGNFSVVDFEAAANTILSIEQLSISGGAAMFCQIVLSFFARASRAVLNNQMMLGDSREQILPQIAPTIAQALTSTRTTGGLIPGTLMGLFQLEAGKTLIIPFRAVLYGGRTTDVNVFKLEVSGQTINTSLTVNISGWERTIEPAEKPVSF